MERDPDLPPDWYFEDDSYTARHEAFDEGFTHACAMLGRLIGGENWEMGDGSESWTGDASRTLENVLEAGRILDRETGDFARLPEKQG